MSVTITDATGSFYVFRTSTKVELGDFITLEGEIGSFDGAKQLAQGATAVITKATALDAAANLDNDVEVVIKGTVSNIAEKDVWSEKYNNMSVTLSDGTNTFYVFRTNTKVELGDVIVVVGKIGSFNDAKQLAQGSYAVILEKASTEGGDEGGEEEGGNTSTEALKNKFDVTVLPVTDTANGNDASSYKDRTSEDGWVATGARVDKAAALTGTEDAVLTLNGKTSAPGTLKSPTLKNGISKIFFNYGFAFGDDQFSITINVKQGDKVVDTTTVEKTGLTKETVYSHTWTLETAVEGEFTLEIINNCKTGTDKNKDRLAIWNLSWDN